MCLCTKTRLMHALGVALLGFLLCTSPLVAQEDGWSAPVNISQRPGRSRFPDMAVDVMGNVHVVWSDDFEGPNSIWGEGIFYTMWDGQAWNLPIDVLLSPDGSSGYAHIPAIASDLKGTIHVVWTDAYQLYYSQAPAVSAGGALSWSSPKLVAGSASGWTRTYFSDITVDNSGTIHMVWEETMDPGVMRDIDVYYSRSTDGGTSWSEITNVSHCLQVSCRRPSIAADESGGVHVVWAANNEETLSLDTGDEVYYIASLDGGDSWLEPERMDESANLSGLPIVVGYPRSISTASQLGWRYLVDTYHRVP